MLATLAANVWHWWIGVILFGVAALSVVGLAASYLKDVTSKRYPGRGQRRA